MLVIVLQTEMIIIMHFVVLLWYAETSGSPQKEHPVDKVGVVHLVRNTL